MDFQGWIEADEKKKEKREENSLSLYHFIFFLDPKITTIFVFTIYS